MNHERIEKIAKVLCKSGRFETGEGTCAFICMDQLGNVRQNCRHVSRVHSNLATQIDEAISE